MANPFKSGGDTPSGSGKMQVGETRILTARDPKTNEVIKTYTLIRTDREYCYDLCDAYNAGLTNPDLEYYVDGAKQVRLGHRFEFHGEHTRELEHKNERERHHWIANHRPTYREAAE